MPFDDPTDKSEASPKVSLKTPQTKSMFDGVNKKPAREEVEKQAHEINERLNSYPERSAELIPLFIKLLNSKTLVQNRSALDDEIETDIIKKLMQLGLDMNNDEYQEDMGSGSIGLTVLLMKCLLIQRNKINELEYAFTQLKSEIKSTQQQKPISALDTKLNDK